MTVLQRYSEFLISDKYTTRPLPRVAEASPNAASRTLSRVFWQRINFRTNRDGDLTTLATTAFSDESKNPIRAAHARRAMRPDDDTLQGEAAAPLSSAALG